MTRTLRLAAVALGSLLVAYAAVVVYAALSFTAAGRAPVPRLPPEVGVPAEDVAFRTEDGLTLRGWYFAVRGAERAAVLVHGKDGNRLDDEVLVGTARALVGARLSVLAFDLRGHGESDGERFSLGLRERLDVAAAVDHLVGRGFAPGRIALVGESMGAGTVIQTLLVRPQVGAVVADSSYANGASIVDERGPGVTGLPPVFTPGIILAARVLLGFDLDAVDPAAVVRASPGRAFLFIHCDGDDVVGPQHAARLRAASANPATELWLARGCGHVGAFEADPGEYSHRLLAFLTAQLR